MAFVVVSRFSLVLCCVRVVAVSRQAWEKWSAEVFTFDRIIVPEVINPVPAILLLWLSSWDLPGNCGHLSRYPVGRRTVPNGPWYGCIKSEIIFEKLEKICRKNSELDFQKIHSFVLSTVELQTTKFVGKKMRRIRKLQAIFNTPIFSRQIFSR